MARRKPWYKAFFERDYYDYFYVGGPRGIFSAEQRDRQAEEQVEFILRALELAEGARVLDLCCGWGRHAIGLAQRGYRVTGLDLSAYHLRLAKAAAQRAGAEIEWLRRDMRDIPGRRRFHAVINMFTSFGYFESDEEDQQVLDGVSRALRPGGRFFIDTMNHDWLMRVFRDDDWLERPDGGFVLERRKYDIHTGRMNADRFYITPEGERRQQSHPLRLYTYTELAAMLARAGLRVRRTWGGFDGRDFSMESPHMIVLAEKG